MKRVIREGVWETNSSSTHAVSFANKNSFSDASLDIYHSDDDGDILEVCFGEFGWEHEVYTDPYWKLKYALTMVAETEEFKDEESFYETEGFKAINELIKEKTIFKKGIKVKDDFKPCSWHEGIAIDGYIDHQSCEDYSCLQDFLNHYDVTLEQFIFNPNVELITDNDNH